MSGDNPSAPTLSDVRSIGEILRDTRDLKAEQVEEILSYQREHGVRFGEAAIALGHASHEDILRALSTQFNYAYVGDDAQEIPQQLIALVQPFSHQAEAFRAIRAQLLLRRQADAPGGIRPNGKAIAVTSPCTGDGKTFFSANLAITLAQLGGRTLLIDADLRGPSLHELFKNTSANGLTALLTGRAGKGAVAPFAPVPGLYVLQAGISPPNPLELIQGPAFGALLLELERKFDHIVVDTPALEFGADGIVAAARCGAALVVARQDRSKAKQLEELVANMSAAGVTVLGTVLNRY